VHAACLQAAAHPGFLEGRRHCLGRKLALQKQDGGELAVAVCTSATQLLTHQVVYGWQLAHDSSVADSMWLAFKDGQVALKSHDALAVRVAATMAGNDSIALAQVNTVGEELDEHAGQVPVGRDRVAVVVYAHETEPTH